MKAQDTQALYLQRMMQYFDIKKHRPRSKQTKLRGKSIIFYQITKSRNLKEAFLRFYDNTHKRLRLLFSEEFTDGENLSGNMFSGEVQNNS